MRKKSLAFVLALLLPVSAARAQSRDPFFTTVSPNYDFVYHELDETSHLGAHFDVASTIKRDVPFIALVGEVGVNHFDSLNVSSYLAGARVRLPNAGPHVLPFVQFLGGLYHCGPCDINDFAIQGGGGLDFRISGSDNYRIRTQVDFRHAFDSLDSFNAVRISVGAVLPLNR